MSTEYRRVLQNRYSSTKVPSTLAPSLQQTAFETLKNVLQSNHVLAYPQTNKPYRLYTDACDYAVGGILVQEGEDGVERVIQYVSHQLDPTQERWATIEKEAYAIVYCLQKLRAYLWRARFTILTDHKPLRSLFQNEMANTKIQRWDVLIAEFGADIQYKVIMSERTCEAFKFVMWLVLYTKTI